MTDKKNVEQTEENNEEVLALEDLTVEQRVERIEYMIESIEQKLNLLADHSHREDGRVVVLY